MLLLASCGGKGGVPPKAMDGPLWTDEERRTVAAYWNTEGRYKIEPAPDPPRVNVTIAGSEWYWRYQRLLPQQTPERQKQWETWVNTYLLTQKAAVQARLRLQESGTSVAQPRGSINELRPFASPPIPADLSDALGKPPALYEIVQPNRYTVTFASEDAPSPFVYTDGIPFAERKTYYPYYRSTNGVIKMGKRVRDFAGDDEKKLQELLKAVGRTESEAKVLKAVSALEGGFEAINTYDTGFVSIGFIQFITAREGNGSLAAVLAQYKTDDPEGFRADFHRFGIDVSPFTIVAAVDPADGTEKRGAEAVQAIINDKRLTAVFERAGQGDGFRKAQVKVARERYWPGEDLIVVERNGQQETVRAGDIVKSEAGLATLMDRKVNRGNIRLINEVAAKLMEKYRLNHLTDLIPYEREIVQEMKFRADFLNDKTLSQPPPPPPVPEAKSPSRNPRTKKK